MIEHYILLHINSFTATDDDKRGFSNSVDPDETAYNEPSYQDICCLTSSLSTFRINFFPIDILFKNKAEDKCNLKFGAERIIFVQSIYVGFISTCKALCNEMACGESHGEP